MLRWLVGLGVSVSPVPDNVDENILLELHAIIHCKLNNFIDALRFISVDVDDRALSRFADVAGIKASSGFRRSCSETDLVVCDDMNDSIDVVGIQSRLLDRLVDNPLTCSSSITMKNDSQCLFLVS